MKKVLGLVCFLFVLGLGQVFAQQPSCSNDSGLDGKIASVVNQGFYEVSREFVFINYFVEPTPPYILGFLQVNFVGEYCGPACTPAIRTEIYNARVTNTNGNCVWELNGN